MLGYGELHEFRTNEAPTTQWRVPTPRVEPPHRGETPGVFEPCGAGCDTTYPALGHRSSTGEVHVSTSYAVKSTLQSLHP